MTKTCEQCGCGHPDPDDGQRADGNPYPQYSPEHRVWAIATQHGRAAAAREGYQEPPDLDDGEYGENQLLADAGWVPHDGTALYEELTGLYRATAADAFESESARRFELADSLRGVMDSDHVIQVGPDGTVTEPSGVHAPDLVMGTDGDGSILAGDEANYIEDAKRQGWQLLTGWTRQHAYRGVCMHASESVGGHLAEHIIANPGQYVVIDVITDDGEPPDGWAVAYRETPEGDGDGR